MKESDHLASLAQEFWGTDQVLFARGLLPCDRLLASELAECSEVRMWESSDFKESASDNVLVASDGSGGSHETPKSVRQVAFGVILQVATHWFLGRSGTRQTDGSKCRAMGGHPDPQPSRRGSRISKSRLMRNT